MSAKDVTIDLIIRYGFQLLGAIVILGVGVVLARWAGNLTNRWLEHRVKEPPMRLLMVRAVRILVLIFTLVLALDKFGFQIAPLVAGIGVAGLGIGIALQGVLSNVVAGLTIIFTKPFRVGEYIELLGVHGQVNAVELFSTTLTQSDLSRVIIPNRKIVGEILHNFGGIRQLDLAVSVAYGASLSTVLRIARDIVERNPRTLKDPEPVLGISELGPSGVTITLQPWVSVADYAVAQAEIYEAIVERFRASEIEIPFPQHEVRLLNHS